MTISLIVAVSENGVIGRNNTLVWRIPEDLTRFKALTMGHGIIMGRRSFESIGRPLDGRRSIVLTRNRDYNPASLYPQADLHIAHSQEEAIRIASGLIADQTFIIGGEQIYRLFLPSADRIYMTRVHHRFEGDTFFPELGKQWQVKEREDHLNARPYPYSFLVYERML
jgi:dihydrofolate reductase